MQSYRAEGDGRMSLLLWLAHYIRFYNIKPAAGLRVISYCDSSSHIKAEKAFHNKDVDSSSWYLKPDHDVFTTLSEVRKGLPFKLISQHVKSQQDDERDFPRPKQLNVLADHRATATAFYPLPTCRGYLRDRNGRYITSREIRTLNTALPENELRDFLQRRNAWPNEAYNSINWSTYSSASARLSITPEHSWSNFTHKTGCPSEYAKDDAAPRLTSAGTATKSRLFLICTAVSPGKRGATGS
jgi:hypothetical protein